MKKIIIVVVVLLITGGIVLADEAVYCEDIAEKMGFFGDKRSYLGYLFDDNYNSYYFLRENYSESMLGFFNESDIAVSHIYIKWADKPERYSIQKSQDGNIYENIMEIETQFLNDLIPVVVEPGEYFRVYLDQPVSEYFSIDAIEIYCANEDPLPEHVQTWEQTASKTDLMIFSAHADDEWVFFGGTIPLYSVEQGKDTVVVYMAAEKFYRKSEALSALWSSGLHTHPEFAPFKDFFSYTVDETMSEWNETDTLKYCVSLIRKYKPDVVLTHDFNGEYGHGNHKATAYAVDKSVLLAQDASYDPESAEEYGTWEVKKLYIHLYEENPITIDFNVPLSSFGGISAYDVARQALKQNISQRRYSHLVYVHDGEEYSCADWGLRYTSVGLDVDKNSFFENIEKSVPDVEIKPIIQDGEFVYEVKNISGYTIENFVVMTDNYFDGKQLYNLEVRDFKPNEVWVTEELEETSPMIRVGYYIEDTIIYWNIPYIDETVHLKDYLSYSDTDYGVGIANHYAVEDIVLTDLNAERDEPESPMSDNIDNDDDSMYEDQADEDKDGNSKNKDNDYIDDNIEIKDIDQTIPIWLWIIIGIAIIGCGALVRWKSNRKK